MPYIGIYCSVRQAEAQSPGGFAKAQAAGSTRPRPDGRAIMPVMRGKLIRKPMPAQPSPMCRWTPSKPAQRSALPRCGWVRQEMLEGGNGGAEGDRTPDLRNAIATLSQLSYGPKPREGEPIRRAPPVWQGRCCALAEIFTARRRRCRSRHPGRRRRPDRRRRRPRAPHHRQRCPDPRHPDRRLPSRASRHRA